MDLPRPDPERGATLVLRAAALGLATGSRSSLSLAGPALAAAGNPWARAGAALAIVGELIGDKLPSTGSRLEPPILLGRIAAGGLGAAVLASRAHAGRLVPVAAGLAGSAAANIGGAAWRAWAPGRRIPDLVAALIEDAVALTLAAWACAPDSKISPTLRISPRRNQG